MTDTAITRPLVLVGVDGSDEGAKAVAWAADYATRTGGTLEMLMAWQGLTSYGYPLAIPGFDPGAAARSMMEKAAAEVSLPRERLRTTVVAGSPAQQLVAASRRANLLVVGSRGHGGLIGLLLGSVGAHSVHHAHCPVVVIRPADVDRVPEPSKTKVDDLDSEDGNR